MKKTAKVTIIASADVLTMDMSEETLTISQEYDIQTLVALGVTMQEDLCDSLIEQLNYQYENDNNILALRDTYISCTIQNGKKDDEDIYLEEDSISPRLRGLYERTQSFVGMLAYTTHNLGTPNLQQNLARVPQMTPAEQYADQFTGIDIVDAAEAVRDHFNGTPFQYGLTVNMNQVHQHQAVPEDGYCGVLIEIEPTSIRVTSIDAFPDLSNGNTLFDFIYFEETDPAKFNDVLYAFNDPDLNKVIHYGRIY